MIYGIDIRKPNSSLQVPFLDYVADHNDEKSLDYFANYFNDSTADDNNLMLFNTAGTYQDIGNYQKAEVYFKKSIEEAKRQNDTIGIWRNGRDLAKMYLHRFKNKQLAWNSLIDLFNQTKINALQYEIGKLSIEQNYKVEKGILFLINFEANQQPSLPDSFYNKSDTYFLIAKAYFIKKNKSLAIAYLQKALNENPNNKEALQWKKVVQL